MGNEKLKFLDGMRGLAALSVVLCHYVEVYYPKMRYSAFFEGDLLSAFGNTPLSLFVNGSTAVQFFFVLTGFLVARSLFIHPEPSRQVILGKCVSRYFRLLPVVAVATLAAYGTMVLGWQCHMRIVGKAMNPDALAAYVFFPWEWRRAIQNAVYEPFVLGGSDFIGPLWTISYELWGYILSLVACYFLKDSRLRRIGYAVLAALLWVGLDWNYAVFFLGVFVADLCYRKEADTTILSRFYTVLISKKPVLYLFLAAGVYLAGCPTDVSGWYAFLLRLPNVSGEMLRAVGIALILYSMMELPETAKLFEAKWMLFVGKLSFSIYAFHMPVMLVVQCGVFEMLYDRVSYDVAAIGSFILYIAAVFLISWGSYELLEKKAKLDIMPFLEKMKCRS